VRMRGVATIFLLAMVLVGTFGVEACDLACATSQSMHGCCTHRHADGDTMGRTMGQSVPPCGHASQIFSPAYDCHTSISLVRAVTERRLPSVASQAAMFASGPTTALITTTHATFRPLAPASHPPSTSSVLRI